MDLEDLLHSDIDEMQADLSDDARCGVCGKKATLIDPNGLPVCDKHFWSQGT